MATCLLLLLAAITSWGGADAAREVCVEGFVMDTFCIKRGTLLDNPSVKTLENPEKHSVHCLVDVSVCYKSGFNILQPNPSGSPTYANAFRLDSVGNQKVLEVARANGLSCSTCGSGGTIRQGLRGTFFGTVTQEATDSQPATLTVKNMTVSPKTLDPNSMTDGCPRRPNKPNVTLSTEASSLGTPSIAPGTSETPTFAQASSLGTPTIAPGSIEVCVEGFVMDKFCIDRGTLLDNPSVTTLENPEKHTVHCLVDVRACYNSGFNILLPNPSGSPAYAYAMRLDDVGNQKVLEVARANGRSCSTCGSGGTIRQGFRGTFFGTITQEATDSQPAMLAVKNVTVSPKTLDPNSTSDGCPEGADKLNLTLFTEAGSLETPSIAHGSLMIIGWGFLLPTGVASALLLKHRPNALWFKIHRIMQIFGLVVAICGWGVALSEFDVFIGSGTGSYNHGVLGMTVMVLGLLQPLNALIRPHPPEAGEKRPLKRLIWEVVHKSSGYIAIILAAVTICYGTIVICCHNTEFRAAWIVTLVWVLLFSLYCLFDGYQYKKKPGNMSVRFKNDEMS